jgi:hypothetical protein
LKFSSEPTNKTAKVLSAFTILSLLLTGITTRNATAGLFSMPEESVNYTITSVDGVLGAKIDGTYPITYTGSETSIPMVYPTPPGTTNISVWLNNFELVWSNFTEENPNALHHTAIGNWSEILAVLNDVSGGFVLRIHYEHPLQVINGSYMFLYDLNIQEYLSASDNRSVAHFTVNIDTNYSNLRVNTVDPETEALKSIAFTFSNGKPAEIKIDEVSEFDKPLPGDLLVSFSAAEGTSETVNDVWTVAGVLLAWFVFAGLALYEFFVRRQKRLPR